MIGLRDSVTGDTLCDTREPILLESIEFPETVISMAIEPESTDDRKKLARRWRCSASRIPRSAPRENEETGQTLISGMGELHLEVIQHRLLRDFNLNVKVHKPRVSYRETVERTVEVTGECNRMIQGVQHAAKVRIRVEPFAKGIASGDGHAMSLDHGLPNEMLSVVLEELESAGQGGGVLGFPLMRLKATVLGGEVGETGISEIAFRTAANHAFDTALREAEAGAVGADHAAGNQHARRARGRPGGRPAAAPRDHPPHRVPRHQHRAARRSPAGEPVRLLQRDAQPEPGPGQLLDGAERLRAGAAGGAAEVSGRDVI